MPVRLEKFGRHFVCAKSQYFLKKNMLVIIYVKFISCHCNAQGVYTATELVSY